MSGVFLRRAQEMDFDAIVRLNESEVQQTSAMDIERLRHLDRSSWYHEVAIVEGTITAFLLAMRHDSPYVNDNFSWFVARYPKFIYVDRIVVLASFARHELVEKHEQGARERVLAQIELLPMARFHFELIRSREKHLERAKRFRHSAEQNSSSGSICRGDHPVIRLRGSDGA